MNNLVESIMHDDLLSASEIFEARIAEIMERKLYEKKRMMQSEAFGGKTPEQVRAKPGFRGRASDVLGPSPYDTRKISNVQPAKEKEQHKDLRKTFRVKKKEDEPVGNSPGAMYKRMKTYLGQKKKEAFTKTPPAPGSAVVNTTKAVGKFVAGGLKRVSGELASHSGLNESN